MHSSICRSQDCGQDTKQRDQTGKTKRSFSSLPLEDRQGCYRGLETGPQQDPSGLHGASNKSYFAIADTPPPGGAVDEYSLDGCRYPPDSSGHPLDSSRYTLDGCGYPLDGCGYPSECVGRPGKLRRSKSTSEYRSLPTNNGTLIVSQTQVRSAFVNVNISDSWTYTRVVPLRENLLRHHPGLVSDGPSLSTRSLVSRKNSNPSLSSA